MDRASNVRAARSIVHFPTIGGAEAHARQTRDDDMERVLGPQVLRHHGGRIAEENRRRS